MIELGEKEGFHTDKKQLRDEMVTFFIAGHDSKFEYNLTSKKNLLIASTTLQCLIL